MQETLPPNLVPQMQTMYEKLEELKKLHIELVRKEEEEGLTNQMNHVRQSSADAIKSNLNQTESRHLGSVRCLYRKMVT